MPDLVALETRLSSDKGYTGESPAKEGLSGFVCPRADAYGGRDGIIPPGVAAVRGLVPKGMRRISKADVARTADEARDSGKSEAEQYREYYGRGAREQQVRAEKAAQAVQTAAPVAAQPSQPSQPPPLPPRPAPHMPVKAAEAPPQSPPQAPAPAPVPAPAPAPERAVARDPDDPGMFSRHPEGPGDADTLDGFYDELGRQNAGTAAPAREAKREATQETADGTSGTSGQGGSGSSAGRGAPVPPASRAYGPSESGPVPPDAMGAALASMVAERDRLAEMASALGRQVDELKYQLAGYEARDEHYANIERELHKSRGEPAAETVRTVLSVQEERLKVGGRGWECNVMGALHFGRAGRSLVLTMTDPAYASELFTELQIGEVVVLSQAGRTSCTYLGRCAKIYGDAGSPDFIAMLWLDVAPAPQ